MRFTRRLFAKLAMAATWSAMVEADGVAALKLLSVRALVISSNYSNAANVKLRLDNPIQDGKRIARALLRSGIRSDSLTTVEEPGLDEWQIALDSFIEHLSKKDVAFVYYAGHGVQVAGTNYFVVSDGLSLLAVDPIIQQIASKAAGVVFVIDACRNNPFRDDPPAVNMQVINSRSFQPLIPIPVRTLAESRSGLSQVGSLKGVSAIVFFSTDPGNVADDGDARGSLFSLTLATQIRKRQKLSDVIRKTTVAISTATQGEQSPWPQGELPFDVYIAGLNIVIP